MWKVLVVDDEFVNRKLILEILKERAECDQAINGAEALTAYKGAIKARRPYDVILLDIAMPDIDGLTVLQKIRIMERKAGISFGAGVPIIMITAYKEPFLDAFHKGCDDYILKPINADDLIAKIEEKCG